jgi:serine/threonine protein kinase
MNTRRQKYRRRRTVRQQRGGAILGEGAKGITYNLCKDDKLSFCDDLDRMNIRKITLFTIDGVETISDPDTIQSFVSFLRTKKDNVAKIMKPTGIFISTTRKEFDNEIRENKHIIKLYGKHVEKYLTIAPIKGFKKYNIFGAMFEGTSTTYAVFGSKCNNKYEIVLPGFLIELLESIIILQENEYEHSDIKLDNIVKCSDRYKLIDWGTAAIMNRKNKPRSLLTTSPLRWYCYDWTLPSSGCIFLMHWKARNVLKDTSNSTLFKEITKQIEHEFYEVLKQGLSRDALYEKYKYSFDLFMLGMTIVYGIYDKPQYHKQYMPVIHYLTSIADPPKNAKEALKHVKSLLK